MTTEAREAMMPTTDHHSIAGFLRTTTLICAAILVAVPIYCVVAYLALSQSPGGFVSDVPPTVVWILAAVAVAQIPVASVVSGALTKSAAARATAGGRLAGWRTATIVGFAVREATAIMGLVVTLVTGDLRWCLGLGALSAAAMLLAWPKRGEAEALACDPVAAPIV
jgi:hypothetical protein